MWRPALRVWKTARRELSVGLQLSCHERGFDDNMLKK